MIRKIKSLKIQIFATLILFLNVGLAFQNCSRPDTKHEIKENASLDTTANAHKDK